MNSTSYSHCVQPDLVGVDVSSNTSNSDEDEQGSSSVAGFSSSLIFQAMAELDEEKKAKKREKQAKKELEDIAIANYLGSYSNDDDGNNNKSNTLEVSVVETLPADASSPKEPVGGGLAAALSTPNSQQYRTITPNPYDISQQQQQQQLVLNELLNLQQQGQLAAQEHQRKEMEGLVRYKEECANYRRDQVVKYNQRREEEEKEEQQKVLGIFPAALKDKTSRNRADGQVVRRRSLPLKKRIAAMSCDESSYDNDRVVGKYPHCKSSDNTASNRQEQQQFQEKPIPLKIRIAGIYSSDESDVSAEEKQQDPKRISAGSSCDESSTGKSSQSSQKKVRFGKPDEVTEIPRVKKGSNMEKLSEDVIQVAVLLQQQQQQQKEVIAAAILQKQAQEQAVAAALITEQQKQQKQALATAILKRQEQQSAIVQQRQQQQLLHGNIGTLGFPLSQVGQQSLNPLQQTVNPLQQPLNQLQQAATVEQARKRRRLSSLLYNNCPTLDEKSQYYLEYGLPLVLPGMFVFGGYSSSGIGLAFLIVIGHTIETLLTNFGSSTANMRLSGLAFISPLYHHLIDCFWLNMAITLLFLMPNEFGPYGKVFVLALVLISTLPIYLSVSYKSHYQKSKLYIPSIEEHLIDNFTYYTVAMAILYFSGTVFIMYPIVKYAGLLVLNMIPLLLLYEYKSRIDPVLNLKKIKEKE